MTQGRCGRGRLERQSWCVLKCQLVWQGSIDATRAMEGALVGSVWMMFWLSGSWMVVLGVISCRRSWAAHTPPVHWRREDLLISGQELSDVNCDCKDRLMLSGRASLKTFRWTRSSISRELFTIKGPVTMSPLRRQPSWHDCHSSRSSYGARTITRLRNTSIFMRAQGRRFHLKKKAVPASVQTALQ